jgi:hypothetical protein
LFFKRKNKLKVDLGELHDEMENLSSFLHSSLNVDVTSKSNGLLVDSNKISSRELKRTVRKFVYQIHLNNRYWVDLKAGVVKIKKFKETEKYKKRKKEGTTPAIITHGW